MFKQVNICEKNTRDENDDTDTILTDLKHEEENGNIVMTRIEDEVESESLPSADGRE